MCCLLSTTLLDDPANTYFALLSQNCVPLHSFSYTYHFLLVSPSFDSSDPESSRISIRLKYKFDNGNSRIEFSGNNLRALWPRDGKPEKRRKVGGVVVDVERNEDIELVLPPLFDDCTKVLEAEDQIVARDFAQKSKIDRKLILTRTRFCP
ncbi:uncharacterized protein HKW66_Vig0210720 [Vigna angularis]|uniref:Uncharacterized protein n=1 Tax=Phaseolus angularis TaxID=3914 RepID=A0A8T0JIQ3_PHAAN|nr:uncharacterized protein HKW66_Vig0210720 [Vigna angularis]